MRVTMQSLYRNILVNLNRNNNDMNRINGQISSGKLMSKISDNPVNLVNALGLRTNLSQLAQYQKNLKYGTTVINSSETALTQMKELTMRAKTLAIQQANAPMTPENRANAAEEVRHLWEQAVILANSSVNGKFIFGGFRTTGYTEAEPAPFVQGARDGYFVNGAEPDRLQGKLTGTVDNTQDLAAGDLLINGEDIGVVVLTGGLTEGLNMGGAANLKTAINAKTADTGVSASLTTLHAGAAATAGNNSVFFYLNGVSVSYSTTAGTPTDAADDAVAAINSVSELTGVTAVRGTGANGGVDDSVVLYNTLAGDESDIAISGYTEAGPGTTGIGNVVQSVDATHNTGQISFSGTSAFEITTSGATSNPPDDDILTLIGLGGGDKGFADVAGDGVLRYGASLAANDFLINGTQVTTASDGISSIYADASAAAKAAAINDGNYGVTAEVESAWRLAAAAVEAGSEQKRLTGTVGSNGIADTDLEINGNNIGPVTLNGGLTAGLNMAGAANLKAAINGVSNLSGVTANLTTLYAGSTATTGGTANVEFTLNGTTIKLNANGVTPEEIAKQVVSAINAQSELTGVTAVRGTGNNGGVVDSIVLKNTLAGDETQIVIAGIDAAESLRTGLPVSDVTAVTTYADATHNTGQITFASESAFTLFSPNNDNDDILKELGLAGGEQATGITGDVADDGRLEYGSAPAYLNRDDLMINGVAIFDKATAISGSDATNALLKAINAKQDETGVVASRDNGGRLIISALDGRNIQVQTSALGEKVTRLTGAEDGNGKAAAGNQVYFGSVRLWSDQPFKLESGLAATTGGDTETGFTALGLAGGSTATGETGDVAGDGIIQVTTIHRDNEYVRYAGDRDNDISFKVGAQSTIEVSKNGYDAVFETGVFSILKELEEFLQGDNFRTATGAAQASNPSATIASGDTGLERADLVTAGSFTVTMTDHSTSPAKDFFATTIQIDPENDTLEDIAQRLNGIPGLKASWDDSGYLKLEARDQERYSFALTNDSSNFLNAAGLEFDNLQVSALGKSIADLDGLLQGLTNQISDFGARANRIEIQTNIYMNLEISTAENLSELEDTDLIQALMELQAKEVAYQASLNAAAKTMKMSLLDYL